ncbi:MULTISPECIES: ATP:cob(I)alamin adenosyltransferase [Vibrio]|uniref:ATP:cob(I)alamin adenosyltransferase n=1 Tax=Vibrio cortegadensis TaxID=1328770 RepID=A0ABV4M2V0_9VIBR|nr:ATP:cob(I)alamin adenosyltransferase [Vibrio genomosp. F6]NOH82273.1 ATP:cob(I)alamin adenosyltransferase [Vibrio sp. 03-59-1]RBW64614.1 ATP:cob(I)alamin adenosyltransferase [Vibrionales bacterium C3R12]TKF21704.1 ATP:cob(I)alamin adenosyltransferase [Vibrio genomosp. F6]
MKPVSRDWDEFCYPFIYEESPVCDFEIIADELCSRVGFVLSMELDDYSRDLLSRVQPNIYHLNGSVRGKLAISVNELEELKKDYVQLREKLDGGFKGFVLPGGHPIASQLHLCRCQAKKIVRALVKIEHTSSKSPDPILFKYANLLANTMYALASYTNQITKSPEVEFVSRSYSMPKK